MTLDDWIHEFRDMLRRRRGLICVVTLLGTLLSVLYALSERHLYTSFAVLQVQPAQVDDTLAIDTASYVGARQLQSVQQRVMSRREMLEIGADLSLLDSMAGLTETEKVGTLREAVEMEGIAAAPTSARDDGAISLVRISAKWTDRASAQALATEIARRTIEHSRDMQMQRARQTALFLGSREDELATRIDRLKEQLAALRRDNALPDPAGREGRQGEISTLRAETLALDRQIMAARQELDAIGQDGLTRVEEQSRAESAARLARLTEERAFLGQRLDSLASAEEVDPATRMQLEQFERQLDALRGEQRDVAERREAAEILLRLETSGQSAQFATLEAASWPDYPSTPSRKKIAAAGALASLFAALGLAWLLDLKTPVVRSAAIMQRDLGFAPIVTIPLARPAPRRSLLRRVFGRRRTA